MTTCFNRDLHFQDLKARADRNEPFTAKEIDMVVKSLQSAATQSQTKSSPTPSISSSTGHRHDTVQGGGITDTLEDCSTKITQLEDINWNGLRDFLASSAHLPYKDWRQTEKLAARLRAIIGDTDHPLFCRMFRRVLEDGRWNEACKAVADVAAAKVTQTGNKVTGEDDRDRTVQSLSGQTCWQQQQQQQPPLSIPPPSLPWVVLVAGLNGIRKTTSVYQSWFPQLLEEALIASRSRICNSQIDCDSDGNIDSNINSNSNSNNNSNTSRYRHLPCGQTCFFRQLDYMLVSLVCEEFKLLYESSDETDVRGYSAGKAAIFARYRTLAEILGVILLEDARRRGLSVMVETSGRDVSSLKYLEHYFPDPQTYQKLLIHFTIDDLGAAEASVDERMLGEIRRGIASVSIASNTIELQDRVERQGITAVCNTGASPDMTRRVIDVNAGGPYGSAVLASVQADSDRVMQQIFDGSGGFGVVDDWSKARICIQTTSGGVDGACIAAAESGDCGLGPNACVGVSVGSPNTPVKWTAQAFGCGGNGGSGTCFYFH